jgi:hypothetical protein
MTLNVSPYLLPYVEPSCVCVGPGHVSAGITDTLYLVCFPLGSGHLNVFTASTFLSVSLQLLKIHIFSAHSWSITLVVRVQVPHCTAAVGSRGLQNLQVATLMTVRRTAQISEMGGCALIPFLVLLFAEVEWFRVTFVWCVSSLTYALNSKVNLNSDPFCLPYSPMPLQSVECT